LKAKRITRSGCVACCLLDRQQGSLKVHAVYLKIAYWRLLHQELLSRAIFEGARDSPVSSKDGVSTLVLKDVFPPLL